MSLFFRKTLVAMFLVLLPLRAAAQEEVRNVILMIGDGMGLAQVYAAMLHTEGTPLQMERAPFTGLVKTHSVSSRVTDSAAAGTALATGRKTLNGYLGLDTEKQPLENLVEMSARKGLGTGVVVTSSVTNATPAAFLAHRDSRKSEDEIALDIASSPVDVLIGGGRKRFDSREDGVNLIDNMVERGYKFYDALEEIENAQTGKIVGLLAADNLSGMRSGRGDYLPRAVGKTLDILSRGFPQGFFVMVEGSLIDGAGHNNDIEAVVREVLDFDEAVGGAFDFADLNPGTLVIVIADHETGGLSIASYAKEYQMGDGVHFSTGGHSGIPVPVYAYGAGAERFTGFMENTRIPEIIIELLKIPL